jgi:hypothetical protein
MIPPVARSSKGAAWGDLMVVGMILSALVVVWGIYIAKSQTIRLTIYPDPVPLSQRTANRVATVFIVLGVALFLIFVVGMLFVGP